VSNTLHNIQLFYNFDSGVVYTGSIDSIRGKSDVNYTFAKQIDIAAGSTHTLNVWLKEDGDSYLHNDSLLGYPIRNSKVVSSFPYLENFEAGDGGYYSGGSNSSWQYGIPASPRINRAASGTKIWKTNLAGHYNNLEKSYLYSPCFDISGLANPMLSFSIALDVENCGNELCDAAYVEYSYDGRTWNKLGAAGKGTNWYDSTFNVWNTQGYTRWHVASIPIPVLGTGQTTHFRFAMSADPGTDFEGIALDDIHVYDLQHPIAPANGITTFTNDLSGSDWTEYLPSNQVLAALQPNNQSVAGATVTLYGHDTLSNPAGTQYTMPRSYSIEAAQNPAGSMGVRLYLLDSDVVRVIKDTTCPSCTKLTDAYSLGITQYEDPGNPVTENGTLQDDQGGVFTYYPYKALQWVPYDKGYYAEFPAKPFSEFWFNNGGPTGNFSVNTDYLNFLAYRNGANVSTYWYSLIDTSVAAYAVQRSDDGRSFTTVSDTPSRHLDPGQYSYSDPVNFTPDSVLYYRLRWTMNGRSGFNYSPVRKITADDSGAGLVTMHVAMVSHEAVGVSWTSFIDPVVHYYKIERAVGDGGYVIANNVVAVRLYGNRYTIADDPGAGIRAGTLVHYRLTVILNDGNQVVLPVQSVRWMENNSLANVYPNPTYDGTLNVAWHADAGTGMTVTLYDMMGRKMYETSAVASQWDNSTTFQAAGLSKGVYLVHMRIGDRVHAAKVVFY